jgi:hypothetical protein
VTKYDAAALCTTSLRRATPMQPTTKDTMCDENVFKRSISKEAFQKKQNQKKQNQKKQNQKKQNQKKQNQKKQNQKKQINRRTPPQELHHKNVNRRKTTKHVRIDFFDECWHCSADMLKPSNTMAIFWYCVGSKSAFPSSSMMARKRTQ